MKITINNYEAYFLDYLEGNLNSEQLSELSLFLSLHPELTCELESAKIIPLPNDDHIYQYKNSLKKLDFESSTISNNNFDDFCIAYYETILTPEKAQELITFSNKNNTYKTRFKSFKDLKLKPQLSIQFGQKRKLYHKAIHPNFISSYILRIGTVAALITVIMIILIETNTGDPKKTLTNVIPKPPAKIERSHVVDADAPKKEEQKSKEHFKSIFIAKLKKENKDTSDYPGLHRTHRDDESLALLNVPEIKPIENPLTLKIKPYEPSSESLKISEDNTRLNSTAETAWEKLKKEVVNFDHFKDSRGNLSLIKLVEAGVTGISKITESNMSVKEKTDSTGKVTAYSFNSDVIKFQKNVQN